MFLRSLLGFWVSKLIMVSQSHLKPPKHDSDALEEIAHLHYSSIPSTNDARIHFCEFQAGHKKMPISKRKVIIHAEGNINTYEQFTKEYIAKAKHFPDYTVAAFNFRNVGKSTGKAYSEDDWIDDAITMVDYYRKKGILTENILLNGHSLGGAILTMAAAKIYAQDKKKSKTPHTVKSVKIINNRSFSDLSEIFIKLYLNGRRKAFVNSLVYTCLLAMFFTLPLAALLGSFITLGSLIHDGFSHLLTKPWISLSLWLTFGTMNALSAYQTLPEESKDYIVAKNDLNIGKKPSLHTGLKTARRTKKTELLEQMKEKSSDDRKKQELHSLFVNIKDCKLESTEGINEHLAPLSLLKTYHHHRPKPLTGEQVMDNKIKRLFKKSSI